MRDDEKDVPNILVIERDAATRSGIKRLLETNGYFVNAVASEMEAESAAPQKNYDLILLDISSAAREFCRR